MKTIQTKPDCTLGFISFAKKCRIGNDDISGEELMNKINKSGYSIDIKKGDKDFTVTIIGKLSEITEDQAKELVEAFRSGGDDSVYKIYSKNFTNGGGMFGHSPIYFTINDNGQQNSDVKYTRALGSLYSAAESACIEEKDFDKFLVIKL